MKSLRLVLCSVIVSAMVACASVGAPTPTTFNEKVAVAMATVTGVRNAADTLLLAGKISSADAANVQTQADNARAGVAIAQSVAPTDLTAANSRLTASITILTALQAYLTAQAGAPK